jgi:5-dehydro-2-deoxygluconokinase
MGEHGSHIYYGRDAIATGVFPVTPIKPTGAGDAFLGSFLAGLSRGEGLTKSIIYGSASAALVVTRVGCAPAMPTLEELSLFVDRHQESVEQHLGRL